MHFTPSVFILEPRNITGILYNNSSFILNDYGTPSGEN